ncbi:hypothetical protein [Streptomyces sp. NPDC059071]|uniref:hypothetical protein n=1 Tax=unclassified Streptomyces TaxID=2593676 RepID=UPI00365D4002
MSDTHDELALCPDCDGLTVTTWSRLTDVTNVQLDDRSVPASTLWIAPTPEPCQHRKQPIRDRDGEPICTCTWGKRCPACRD